MQNSFLYLLSGKRYKNLRKIRWLLSVSFSLNELKAVDKPGEVKYFNQNTSHYEWDNKRCVFII